MGIPSERGYIWFSSSLSRIDLEEIKVAIDLWIETAKKDGREIPKPAGKELLKAVVEEKAVTQPMTK